MLVCHGIFHRRKHVHGFAVPDSFLEISHSIIVLLILPLAIIHVLLYEAWMLLVYSKRLFYPEVYHVVYDEAKMILRAVSIALAKISYALMKASYYCSKILLQQSVYFFEAFMKESIRFFKMDTSARIATLRNMPSSACFYAKRRLNSLWQYFLHEGRFVIFEKIQILAREIVERL
jgi:hypothetical protein